MVRQTTHIRYQRVVAKRGAAITNGNRFIAGLESFIHYILHIPRRLELPLLNIHWNTLLTHILNKVG
jgi:hypothetical protein